MFKTILVVAVQILILIVWLICMNLAVVSTAKVFNGEMSIWQGCCQPYEFFKSIW